MQKLIRVQDPQFTIYVLDFIIRNMNFTVDPCIDFYEYTCGGWIKDNPVPSSQSHRNQFQVAEERLQAQLKGRYDV